MSNDNNNQNRIDVLEREILEIKIKQLEKEFNKTQAKYEEIIQKLAESQSLLANKIIALEMKEQAVADQLSKMLDSTKTQGRLLLAIATSCVGAIATVLIKMIIGG